MSAARRLPRAPQLPPRVLSQSACACRSCSSHRIVVIAGALYFYFTGGRYESTDDAYVQAAQVAVSSNVGGPRERD
jgi:hypothetical protein